MILSQERQSDLYLVFSKDSGEEERRRNRVQAASRKGEEGGEGEEGGGEGKGAQPEIFSSQSFLKGEEGVGRVRLPDCDPGIHPEEIQMRLCLTSAINVSTIALYQYKLCSLNILMMKHGWLGRSQLVPRSFHESVKSWSAAWWPPCRSACGHTSNLFFCKSTQFEIIKVYTLNKTKACQKRGVISVSIILSSFVKY